MFEAPSDSHRHSQRYTQTRSYRRHSHFNSPRLCRTLPRKPPSERCARCPGQGYIQLPRPQKFKHRRSFCKLRLFRQQQLHHRKHWPHGQAERNRCARVLPKRCSDIHRTSPVGESLAIFGAGLDFTNKWCPERSDTGGPPEVDARPMHCQ